MPPVANDFAAIAKRLKEIQQEVAAEAAARNHQAECEPDSHDVDEEIAACE